MHTHMRYTEVNCIKIYIEFTCMKHTHHVFVGATNSYAQLTKKQQPTFEILLSQIEFF